MCKPAVARSASRGLITERWLPAVIAKKLANAKALVYCDQGFLLDAQGQVLFDQTWVTSQDLDTSAVHGLGHFDGQPVYLHVLHRAQDFVDCHWQGLRQFMLEGDFSIFKMLGYAAQIATWGRQHRFCGNCGMATQHHSRDRAMCCPGCKLQHYPRISPSMIVLITRGDEVLLGRSPRFVTGMYSALAGFVEPGESAEECVVREVYEEVQVQIRDICYVGSQCWPFPHSMMLGFHAEYASGDIVPQPGEIEDARWFSIHDLPPLPAPRSIARHLIDLYVARRLGLPEPQLIA